MLEIDSVQQHLVNLDNAENIHGTSFRDLPSWLSKLEGIPAVSSAESWSRVRESMGPSLISLQDRYQHLNLPALQAETCCYLMNEQIYTHACFLAGPAEVLKAEGL